MPETIRILTDRGKMFTADGRSTFRSKEDATEIRDNVACNDPAWRYELIHILEYWSIQVHDDDENFVGYL